MRFEGILSKIELVSYAYDKSGKPQHEFEQRLSLSRDGAGRIVCYTYEPKEMCRDERFAVDRRAASDFFDRLGNYASEYDRSELEWPDDDFGEWNLIMENTRRDLFRINGRVCPGIPAFSQEISDQIRELTGLTFLAAFDGGAEQRKTEASTMTVQRIFVADMGDFKDSSKYKFVADFADQKIAAKYVKYMRGKKRYEKQDIIVKEVPTGTTDSAEGNVVAVISVMGESLPVEEYEFR